MGSSGRTGPSTLPGGWEHEEEADGGGTGSRDLGKRVRALRKERKLTQAAFAERARLHEKFISDVEVGSRDVRLSTLIKLAKGLGVDPLSLFRWTTEDELIGEIEGLAADRRDPVVRGHLLRLIREALLMLDSAK